METRSTQLDEPQTAGDRPAGAAVAAPEGDHTASPAAAHAARPAGEDAAALPASGPDKGLPAPAAPGAASIPRWIRTGGAASWRLVAIAVVSLGVLYLLSYLHVVTLPIIIAILLTTLLLPPVRRLRRAGLAPALATALVMLGGTLLFVGLIAAIAPSIASQGDELRTGVQDGIREASDILAQPPFNQSETEIRARVDDGIDRLSEDSGPLTEGLTTGAILLGEIITGLFIVVLLTFFFLKDGERMWSWIVDFVSPPRRAAWNEVGSRVLAALGGYVRGIALVGLVDAILVGLALLIIGVPLVLPLMVLTFLGAFLPLIGAFLAGLAAVLIALVSNGLLAAALVLGAIVVVQQVEGHLLYPLLMGKTVHLHPAVIVIALAVGAILAGVVGVFLAVPVAGVISVILAYVRNEAPPSSPVADTAPATPAG